MKKSLLFFLASQLLIALVCFGVVIFEDDLSFWLSSFLVALGWLAIFSTVFNYIINFPLDSNRVDIADEKLGEWARGMKK